MKYDVKDIKLANKGLEKINWANEQMPVLAEIRKRFEKEKPLKDVRIAACLHVTSETANLMRTLKAGGALVYLCASNPLSTQDDTAAAIVKHVGVSTFAIRGENRKVYYNHIESVLSMKPHITLDDGADLVSTLHSHHTEWLKTIFGGMEETTTGVIRLRSMEKSNALKYPIVAVNDAETKYLFDNRYGTGQSTIDGIIRATNVLLAGKVFVVAGYGWCGRGLAMRARGLGANVVVTEVNPIRAIEAAMDGFSVKPMSEAIKIGEIFCTLTGNKHVLRVEHFTQMKSGAILCNSGHFNVEIDLEGLEKISKKGRMGIRSNIDEFMLKNGKTIFVLAQGRLVNLACAEGHPPSVMDMSFATQSLMAEYVAKNRGKMPVKVIDVPMEIENWIATLKLKTMGLKIDTMTPEQVKYVNSWQEGT